MLKETQIAESPDQHLRNRALNLLSSSCPGHIIPDSLAFPEYGLPGKEVEDTFGCSLRARLVYFLIYPRWFTPLQGLPHDWGSVGGLPGTALCL